MHADPISYHDQLKNAEDAKSPNHAEPRRLVLFERYANREQFYGKIEKKKFKPFTRSTMLERYGLVLWTIQRENRSVYATADV